MAVSETPLIPDVGLLALLGQAWGDIWQTRHQLVPRLGRYFPTLWVNPTREWRESLSGLVQGARRTPHPPPNGVEVYTPEWWLPQLYRPAAAAALTERLRLRRAVARLRRRGCRRVLLSVWRPNYASDARRFDREYGDYRYYHVDDEYSFSEQEVPVSADERMLLETSRRVFLHSPALTEKKGSFNPRTLFSPNGVDYSAFARPQPEPTDLADVPRPRIGYTGWLKRQLDWPLLNELVRSAPDLSFVFAGGTVPSHGLDEEVGRLAAHPNVHITGKKSTAELTAYPQHFDVCLLPYARTPYTRYIYPLKLHEYLATGVPVVATPIATVEKFADIVELAATPEAMLDAVRRSLMPEARTPARAAARQEEARRHDWDALAAHIALALAADLGPEFVERLDAAGVRPGPPPVR